MHLPLLTRLLLLLFQLLILTLALPSAGSTKHEAPISALDPDNAGSFPAVDAAARDAEQPAGTGTGMRKRAWSLGRMLLPYEK